MRCSREIRWTKFIWPPLAAASPSYFPARLAALRRTADRVEVHSFVATLAFLIHRAIELKVRRLDFSASDADNSAINPWSISISATAPPDVRLPHYPRRAAAVLRALGITTRRHRDVVTNQKSDPAKSMGCRRKREIWPSRLMRTAQSTDYVGWQIRNRVSY